MTLDKGEKKNEVEAFYDPEKSSSSEQIQKWYNDYKDEVCLWGLCVKNFMFTAGKSKY